MLLTNPLIVFVLDTHFVKKEMNNVWTTMHLSQYNNLLHNYDTLYIIYTSQNSILVNEQ